MANRQPTAPLALDVPDAEAANLQISTRREFLHTAGRGLGALAVGSNMLDGCKRDESARRSSPREPADSRPNILFILTDDQRWDAFGAAGNPIIHTPNMDELASDGVRFENAFVTTPVCAASRASVLTGLYERRHRCTFGTPPLAKQHVQESFPARLRASGYWTGHIGKFGVQVDDDATAEMYDVFEPIARRPYLREVDGVLTHVTDLTGERAAGFLRAAQATQPFCLTLSFNAPHAEDRDLAQYIWPAACDSLYRDVSIPAAPSSEPAFFEAHPDFLKSSLNRVRWKWRFDTPEKYQTMVKGYYRMISGVDLVLGRIRKELKDLGLADNTLLVLMGDNGYFLGERGFAGKWLMYEPSLRVPLILYDPRGQHAQTQTKERRQLGLVATEPVLNIDIAPTLIDMANLEPGAQTQGASLQRLLAGNKVESWRREFFCEHLFNHRRIPQSEGVRTNDWKYIRYRAHPEFEELYDLKRDPLERRNLARDKAFAARLEKLRESGDQWIARLT